jgi:hypothetical protein
MHLWIHRAAEALASIVDRAELGVMLDNVTGWLREELVAWLGEALPEEEERPFGPSNPCKEKPVRGIEYNGHVIDLWVSPNTGVRVAAIDRKAQDLFTRGAERGAYRSCESQDRRWRGPGTET